MDPNSIDTNEFSVSEGAFWHTNMDLYYGYQPGEVVEVEHESNKYWLATIEYSFKHLVLLRWIGNYGEFWVDTSMQNSTTGSSNEFNAPKRLFPPGYHLQSQIKSQFDLERPIKVLVQPSLYNPAMDPYAEIETVDDLLTHEIDHTNDAFGNQSSTISSEPASLVMAKCKTKIAYGQEDVDELEAALQNLNEIDSDIIEGRNESPDNFNLIVENLSNKAKFEDKSCNLKSEQSSDSSITADNTKIKKEKPVESGEVTSQLSSESAFKKCNERTDPKVDHEAYLEMCKTIQESAMGKGRYVGIGEHCHKVYFLKPKQFFDIGGANYERVFVPGTLLEISHTVKSGDGLELCHWFAIVMKNVGGRLTLRWFICDEPRFKQGRLELKSCHSEFIQEEEDAEVSGDNKDEQSGSTTKTKIPVKNITFCMHFCNPCVHSISHARSNQRPYKMPGKMISSIREIKGFEDSHSIELAQWEHIFDYRRMNLDKDRPIIDHLLSTVRWMMPQYIDLTFAPKDKYDRREVLISTPRTTKLSRGFVKRELEPGIFEVHSEPISDNGEVIKFIYPYDSSYSILPTSWAVNNEDCLSIHTSRNPTPTSTPDKSSSTGNIEQTEKLSKECGVDQVDSARQDQELPQTISSTPAYEPINVSPFKLLCEIAKTNLTESEIELADSKLTRPEGFDELEPSCWSRLMRAHELDAPEFQCSINCTSMNAILSKFRIMDQLEVVHPSSDVTVCLGRIRKVVYPLLWIQISTDSYTLLPFNSTDIYPSRWCETNNHPLISLLPPRKRLNQFSQPDKKRKKTKNCDDADLDQETDNQRAVYEKEHFDLGALNDKQMDIDYILNEKTMYIRIYFNHKCFTGPSLSKGKICSLPQYVGPGPLRLVMEEVVTKVISVAYVPPRILNDLSSKTFEDLLIARNLTNIAPMEFKAKYQKRVHREDIPVCLNPDDVALYCECICEHLKCCYNLFGPNLYDGDDCPGHCRALTKSNKFMKRATYYREKARLGEFINDNGNTKKSSASNNSSSNKTSRARYSGRDSSESTSSSISRSEQLNSRASSAGDEVPINESKENLVAVEEMANEEEFKDDCMNQDDCNQPIESGVLPDVVAKETEPEMDKILHSTEQEQNVHNILACKLSPKWPSESEFSMFDAHELRPENWTVDDVAEHLEWCRLDRFKPYMVSESVDGQALLLLDKFAIREHFQHQPKSEYTQEEVGKLCRFVEFVKARAEVTA